ncbi:hypothetical protein [Frankia gtarii]|uniref:hypothetical protein n=1 Tax=Frankia gtarii TaxID=2950102 RepID=UPI0021BF7425|nr:hypothetical protein [Frankia gtarii]
MEVYGRAKRGVASIYEAKKAGRPLPASWARTGLVLAADLLAGAQVTAVDHAPVGWPPGTYRIIRRVKVFASEISADPRSRRRRTIPKDQLTLALEGVSAPQSGGGDAGHAAVELKHHY